MEGWRNRPEKRLTHHGESGAADAHLGAEMGSERPVALGQGGAGSHNVVHQKYVVDGVVCGAPPVKGEGSLHITDFGFPVECGLGSSAADSHKQPGIHRDS